MGSVPALDSAAAAQSTFAATLFDEFTCSGMAEIVVCPGSRSTPLALAALGTEGLEVHVRLDERSAGFFAIGRSLATGQPVGVVVTSGTAAAELHAAVVEADLARVALVVMTADRPPELHGVGAPQTIDQTNLFGGAVRRFEDPGPIRPGTEASWRPLAARAMAAATGPMRGPVHLNLPFVEPLDRAPGPLPQRRPGGAAWRSTVPVSVVPDDDGTRGAARVVVVAGRGIDDPSAVLAAATARRWPVLADPLSGCRTDAEVSVAAFDALTRDDAVRASLRPDVVVQLGAMPASRALSEALDVWSCELVVVDQGGRVQDPFGRVARVVEASAGSWARAATAAASAPCDDAFLSAWRRADDAAQDCFDALLEGSFDEPSVARGLSGTLPGHVVFVVSSSMPVRDLEWFGRRVPRGPLVVANRGANGIDGVVSTALGASIGGCAVCLLGDLAFLHDAGALADGLGGSDGSCVLVVVDNAGGGIFSFLPQRSSVAHQAFERVLATPPSADVAAVARGYGADVTVAEDLTAMQAAVDECLARPGVHVVVAAMPSRDENVELHRRYGDAAGSAARLVLR